VCPICQLSAPRTNRPLLKPIIEKDFLREKYTSSYKMQERVTRCPAYTNKPVATRQMCGNHRESDSKKTGVDKPKAIGRTSYQEERIQQLFSHYASLYRVLLLPRSQAATKHNHQLLTHKIILRWENARIIFDATDAGDATNATNATAKTER